MGDETAVETESAANEAAVETESVTDETAVETASVTDEIAVETESVADDTADETHSHSEAEDEAAESEAEITIEISKPAAENDSPSAVTLERRHKHDLEAGWVGIGSIKDCHPLSGPVQNKCVVMRRSQRHAQKITAINRSTSSTSASRRNTICKTRKCIWFNGRFR